MGGLAGFLIVEPTTAFTKAMPRDLYKLYYNKGPYTYDMQLVCGRAGAVEAEFRTGTCVLLLSVSFFGGTRRHATSPRAPLPCPPSPVAVTGDVWIKVSPPPFPAPPGPRVPCLATCWMTVR